ncbi:nucleotide sugar dehydrogenase [Thozetella sp. PMI_491]|nr:nucleotide sugar dehydrogenase [Thozetella sp. PMI_491]
MTGATPMPASAPDAEEPVLFESSTAPTTPEGSLSFSPVLRPRNAGSADIEAANLSAASRNNSRSLTSALLDTTTPPPPVRTICCVGAGYVGGPTAAVIALQNPHIRVTVVDKDERRIRRWNSRHPPIYEPGLNEIVRIARDGSRECVFVNEPTKQDGSDHVSEASTSSSECGSQCGDHHDVTAVAARQPNLFFTTDVARSINEADIVLIAVNTPTKYRGVGAGAATDMTAFEAVTSMVAQNAKPGAIIVEKSTVPCRTAQLVQSKLSLYRPGVHFEILSNPEFLAAGTAMNDLLTADRVLIGSSSTAAGHRAAQALASVYAAWIPRSRIITTNVFSAELTKLVANSMLAQRISSINSVAALCEKLGADVDEVAFGLGTDQRIGNKFLKAGIGFGGSCFKKDILSLVYLAESLELPEVADYWRSVVTINEYSRDRFALRVIKALNNTLLGKKVTILGYAFKKNTNDTRESPALEIIKTLVEEGPRELAVFDPCCVPAQTKDEIRRLVGRNILKEDGGMVEVYESAYEACHGSDAVLITTEFDEFKYSPNREALSMPTAPRAGPIDPRPFKQLEPTESDLLSLHKYLLRTAPASTLLTGVSSDSKDPLNRFHDLPACLDDCPDCQLEKTVGTAGYGAGEEYVPKARIDWAKISYHMQQPKWVFDGRGVLDIAGMEKLGFRVETVGRQNRAF